METRFYTLQGINDSGDPVTNLIKAVYDNGLKAYNVADSSDAGEIYMDQTRSPWHRDSADGVHPELGTPMYTIVEFNRAWDSAGEAFNWFEGGL